MNPKLIKSVFNDDPDIQMALQSRALGDMLLELEKRIDEIELTPGPKGDSIKGDQGEKPTDEELKSIILPLIPEPIKGDAGYTPIKGRDYFDGRDADPIDEQKIISSILKQIPPAKPGKDGESVTLEMVIDHLTSLKGADASTLGKKLGAMIDASWLRNANSFMFNGKKYKIEELMHGGSAGSTSSGQNVTTQYLLTAIQSGSDVTIDLTQLTNWATFSQIICLYRNNQPQTLGVDFTFASPTVTITGADSSEIFNITYAFTS